MPTPRDEKKPMDQISAHLDRGWDLVAHGDLAGALLSAQKTLELAEESPEAHNLMGYIFAAEGEPEKALEHYRRAIDIEETFVEAMLNAAEVLMHPMRDSEAAIRMIDDALEYCETAEEIADAALLKVDALMHLQRREAARKLLDDMPEGPFEVAQTNFLIGRAYFDLGELDGAEKRLRAAIEQESQHADSHYYLGLLHEARKQPREAVLELLTARDLYIVAPPVAWSIERKAFEEKLRQVMLALPGAVLDKIEDALVVVADMPGLEVIADGVDPHAPVLLEGFDASTPEPGIKRVFVYQRNVENLAGSPQALEESLTSGIVAELAALFPELASLVHEEAASNSAPAAAGEDGAASEDADITPDS